MSHLEPKADGRVPIHVPAGQHMGANHLYRHNAVKADLASLEDHAHPSVSDFLHQFVVAEIANPQRFRSNRRENVVV